jgi:hypothetical protein
MKRYDLPGSLGLLVAVAALGVAGEPPPAAQLDALLAVIRPQLDEDRWARIDWRTDLWAAREEAARRGKPILLWEMDGHPLGCV